MLRGPAISFDFKNVIARTLGEQNNDKAVDHCTRLLYDFAYAVGRADCESFSRQMAESDPLVLLAAGTINFAFRGICLFVFFFVFVLTFTGWGIVNILPESVPTPTSQEFFLLYEHPYSFEAAAYMQHGEQVSRKISPNLTSPRYVNLFVQ